MSVSTDGQICFGILFEESFEFPWDLSPWDGEYEDWWRDMNGYEPPFNLYDSRGNYLDGIEPSKDRIHEYYAARREFDKARPFPVELVNVCSCDFPIYILAAPGTFIYAARGYPKELGVTDLAVKTTNVDALYAFCKKYGIETEASAKWYLSGYWG